MHNEPDALMWNIFHTIKMDFGSFSPQTERCLFVVLHIINTEFTQKTLIY